jgi:hypothetical protein
MGQHNGMVGKGKDGKWRIPTLKVEKSDDIAWSTEDGSEFCIWFPPGRDPLTAGPSRSSGGKLTRKVLPIAAKGNYYYSIFRYADNTMVESSSSPEMIVQ